MSTLIVPICGKSERYGLNKPKWSLPVDKDGTSMLEAAMSTVGTLKKLLIYRRQDHSILNESNIPFSFLRDSVALTEQTSNQVETIRTGLVMSSVQGSILIKDCDNEFKPEPYIEGNFIGYAPLEGVVFNPEAKSYVQLNDHNEVVNVVEKKVISDKFCCGLYGFAHADQFLYYSDGCEYVSQVILKMLLAKEKFVGVKCSNYLDWGTRESYEYFTGNKL